MLEDITQAGIPSYEPENEYWKTALDLMRKGTIRPEGKKWLVSFPDLIERLDILPALRETSELLLLLDINKKHIRRLVQDLSPEGLLIRTSCSHRQEADELLGKVL